MKKYILMRILRSILSLVAVVFIIMLLIFQLMDRNNIFMGSDLSAALVKQSGVNNKTLFKYRTWQEYGYLNYVSYNDYIVELAASEGKSVSDYDALPNNQSNDASTPDVMEFINSFSSQGYTIVRMNDTTETLARDPLLLAYKNTNVFARLWNFFTNIFVIDHINTIQPSEKYIEDNGDIERYIRFEIDPNGRLAVVGSGTKNRYLLYFDSQFPFIHQNFITLNLGKRYANGEDFFSYFTKTQGDPKTVSQVLANGETVESAQNYYELTFNENSFESDVERLGSYYTTVTGTYTAGLSMIGYSFVIGVIATLLVYILGVPLGLLLALKKDKIADKIGNLYIIFIMAVPSLAYIYIFSTIGSNVFGLPNTWAFAADTLPIYILPIVSLALPSIANMMKWVRRYMIDQMNSDYVKFARSQGFSERQIFSKHILKNALIPIAHGIPASFLGALTGAIITERVYGVPGIGNVLTNAINSYDNGVIIGISFFYALISIVSVILGDVLMSKVDPRISFSAGGGRK